MRCPPGLGPAGKRLWRQVTGEFELAGGDVYLLEQACATADTIEALAEHAAKGPPVGPKGTAPAVRELRLQKITLARLLAALRVVAVDDGDHRSAQQHAGFRGTYGGHG